MPKTLLTSWRMPFQIEELRSSTLVVGTKGQSGELSRKHVRSIELQDHGGVLVAFQVEKEPPDMWVFTGAGYGRVLPPEPKLSKETKQ